MSCGAQSFPPHCHTTWLATSLQATKTQPISVQQHHTLHSLTYVRRTGPHGIRLACICSGRERLFSARTGMLRFQVADDQVRTYFGTISAGDHFDSLLIPTDVLQSVSNQEGFGMDSVRLRSFVVARDPVLKNHVERFIAFKERDQSSAHNSDHGGAIARELVLRLCELSGGAQPHYHANQSSFDSATFGDLLDVIDTQLAAPPSQAALARRVALSSSHFARKFRNTTGQSLHRFINTRRVHAAMRQLLAPNLPAARLAFDLGFSSQSHFTRIFKATTGMTPARYRRPFPKTQRSDEQNMPNTQDVQEIPETVR